MRSACRANQPSSGWLRLSSSSPITTSGSTTSESPKRMQRARVGEQDGGVEDIRAARGHESSPVGRTARPRSKVAGPRRRGRVPAPLVDGTSAPTGPPVDGEGSSSSTADAKPDHRQKCSHHPERDRTVHPKGYQSSHSSQAGTAVAQPDSCRNRRTPTCQSRARHGGGSAGRWTVSVRVSASSRDSTAGGRRLGRSATRAHSTGTSSTGHCSDRSPSHSSPARRRPNSQAAVQGRAAGRPGSREPSVRRPGARR